MNFFEWLNLLSEHSKKDTKENQENNLTPWQQEEVEKGTYDITSFEEEDLEDDDYFVEDDE